MLSLLLSLSFLSRYVSVVPFWLGHSLSSPETFLSGWATGTLMVLIRGNATSRLSYCGEKSRFSLFSKRKCKILKAFYFSQAKEVTNKEASKVNAVYMYHPSLTTFQVIMLLPPKQRWRLIVRMQRTKRINFLKGLCFGTRPRSQKNK